MYGNITMDFDGFLASIDVSPQLASSANLTRELLCRAQRSKLTPRERLSERFRSLPQLRLGVRLRLTHHLHELRCDGGEAGSPLPTTTPQQPRAPTLTQLLRAESRLLLAPPPPTPPPPERFVGHCGATKRGTCLHGSSSRGVLPLPLGLHGAGALLSRCLSYCQQCERCAWVSFSSTYRDCSWYTSCASLVVADPRRPTRQGDFVTFRIDRTRARPNEAEASEATTALPRSAATPEHGTPTPPSSSSQQHAQQPSSRIDGLRRRAAAEAGGGSRTLSFYTDTCRRLWSHELDAGCTPLPPSTAATREVDGGGAAATTTTMARVGGEPPWTREQLCAPPTATAAAFWSGSTREVKLVSRARRGARYASVYVSNHKAGTDAVGQLGSRVLRLNATCATADMSLVRVATWWSVVRDPISRFVSAFNTILTLKNKGRRVMPRYNCSDAAIKARLHRLYLHGMLRSSNSNSNRGDGSSGSGRSTPFQPAFRYDMHTATQASELACMQRPPGAEVEGVTGGGGVQRLRLIERLEDVGRRNGSVDASLLPGLRMTATHQGLGTDDNCAMSRDDLTPALLRVLCRYYAQDYVCFGYELPSECADDDGRQQQQPHPQQERADDDEGKAPTALRSSAASAAKQQERQPPEK